MSIKMDQAMAQKLFEEGGILIFLNVPKGTEFGIDMKSWNTGDKFRGVKMIPPGLHFIFYSSVSKIDDTVVAPRVGFFYNFKATEIVVKKWDKQLEGISDETIDEREIVGLKHNLTALDEFLGPYPYDIWEKWISLTSNITINLLNRLTPECGQIRSALELQSCSDADRPRGVKSNQTAEEINSSNSKRKETELLPNLKPIEGTELRLTKFPERNYPDGCSPAEITKHSLDSTYVLETMLNKYSTQTEILGEIEFCYVCFLVGHSLEAFEQWKKLITLFCCCDNGVEKYQYLFDKFITILQIHINEIPEDFLADIVTNNNFVYVNLRKLFRTFQECNINDDFKMKIERFKRNLTQTFGWDFEHLESEDEDEAPVIVET